MEFKSVDLDLPEELMAEQRLCLTIHGAVQGVGFRPFIYRLATRLDLKGWVNNSAQGVELEVEGHAQLLDSFLAHLKSNPPPRAVIETIAYTFHDSVGYSSFEIRTSSEGAKKTLILPDIATCADCLRELFDPCDRRYRYPFTNCTHCGPRYSIIQALPYDRQNTTMRHFKMCPDCQSEYTNPLSRRFHAQPNACPTCGPQVKLWDQDGEVRREDDPIALSAEAIRQGKVLAVKGLGGFHLMVDARNSVAVERLRERKHRPDQPFALMYPSLEQVRQDCEMSDVEEELLRSHTAPIVLLKRKRTNSARIDLKNNIVDAVAPGSPHLGIMLPYTPLHHLLMADLQFPIVATSGNPSGTPICCDEDQALQHLKGLADLYLVHNRPIQHPTDDSIIQVINNQPQIRRRARGYAPLPITPSLHPPTQPSTLKLPTILAVGAHLKNTIALSLDDLIFLSPHLGDLGTLLSLERFDQTIRDFLQLYDGQPDIIACDAHPDYASTQAAQALAQAWQVPVISVQHHYAHVLACMAEHHLEAPALGIAWDGSGYGLDGTLWGGEFLQITPEGFERVGYLRPFQLPGGEKAIQEPRRTALGVLYSVLGKAIEQEQLASIQAFSPQSLKLLYKMLNRQVNTPMTSSVGRLFDAIASLTNKVQISSYEGQAAIALESVLAGFETEEHYPFQISSVFPLIVDWVPMLTAILEEIAIGSEVGFISSKFHNTLVEIIINVSHRVGEPRVVLTGGCFQNRYLSERTIGRLRAENFQPYWHQQIPSYDGCIALGQVMAIQRNQTSSITSQDVPLAP